MSWLLGIGRSILGVLGSFARFLSDTFKIWGGILIGYQWKSKKTMEENLEIKDKQLEIASRPDEHRSSLLDKWLRRKRK